MNIDPSIRRQAKCILVAAALVLIDTTSSRAESADPTTPSPSIAARLAEEADVERHQPGIEVAEPKTPPLHFRLKGIVLRDSDNATALISVEGSPVKDAQSYVVTLRRANLHSASNCLNMAGMHLAVKDFSETCIVMQDLETDQQLIIN